MVASSPALTPDFYRYEPSPPTAVSCDGEHNTIDVVWPDAEHRFHGAWLRENSLGHGIDPITREGIGHPRDHLRCRVTGAVSTGAAIEVRWDDGLVAAFDTGWLRSIVLGHQDPWWALPSPVPWVTGAGAVAGAVEAHADVPNHRWPLEPGDDELAGIVADFIRFGAVRFVDGPDDDGALEALAVRFGALYNTSFGRIWDVVAKVDPNSTAFTSRALVPHTDLPTRERPPMVQMLHCVENTCEGGLNQLADGLAIVEHIRVTDPDAHEALTTLRWVFMSKGVDVDHRWEGPIVDYDDAGRSVVIRGFSPVRSFPSMPVDQVERAYRAVALLHELGADPAFRIESSFRAGDCVMFDNWRILHARSAFDATAGRRRLRGCYISSDEFRSSARVLLRPRAHT